MKILNLIGALTSIVMPIHRAYPDNFDYSAGINLIQNTRDSVFDVYTDDPHIRFQYSQRTYYSFSNSNLNADYENLPYIGDGNFINYTGSYNSSSSSKYFTFYCLNILTFPSVRLEAVDIEHALLIYDEQENITYYNYDNDRFGDVDLGSVFSGSVNLLDYEVIFDSENQNSQIWLYSAFSFDAFYDAGNDTLDFLLDARLTVAFEYDIFVDTYSPVSVVETVDLSKMFFDFLTMPFIFFTTALNFEIFGFNIGGLVVGLFSSLFVLFVALMIIKIIRK